MAVRDEIETGLSALSINASAAQIDSSLHYLEMIERWNRVSNLTAVRKIDDMVSLHLLDSLSVLPFVTGQKVLDVGSGAGLPGIPLAMFCPDKDFILLDSNGKKTRFMTQAKIELSLGNIQIVHARIEDFSEMVDQVICRAFTSLTAFSDQCGRLLQPSGSLLAMKGPAEADSPDVNGWHKTTHELQVPQLVGHRILIELCR